MMLYTYALLLGLFALEMIIMAKNDWTVSRSTPVSNFVVEELEGSTATFCKTFWVTLAWYSLFIPMMTILVGALIAGVIGFLGLFFGLELWLADLVQVGMIIDGVIGVFFTAILLITGYQEWQWKRREAKDKLKQDIEDGVKEAPKRTIIDGIADAYGSFKDKFCPIITLAK